MTCEALEDNSYGKSILFIRQQLTSCVFEKRIMNVVGRELVRACVSPQKNNNSSN